MSWQRTKPAAGDNLESDPLRGNFQALDAALWGKNLLANSEFLIWPAGSDTGANEPPAHWQKVGSPAVSMVTAAADIKKAPRSLKMTYSGAGTDEIKQDVLPTGAYNGELDGLFVAGAAWVASASSGFTLGVDDGDEEGFSSAHSGGGAFELLTFVHEISAASTKLSFINRLTASGSAVISQPTLVFGQIPPQDTLASEIVQGNIQFGLPGTIATGIVTGGRYHPWQPYFVVEGYLAVDTVPNANPVELNLAKWDGSSWINMYTTNPISLTTGQHGALLVPNATSTLDSTGAAAFRTWARSFAGLGGSSGVITSTDQKNNKIRANVELADDTSTAPSSDGELNIRILQYKRPLAAYLNPQDLS